MILILGIIVVLFAVYEIWKPMAPSSIAQYAANAGFSGFDLVEAVAIAYAESGGDANSEGDWTLDGKLVSKGTPGAVPTSIGLWQIHYTVHPEFDPAQLKDPQYNANFAFAIYQQAGNSFTPWTTFNSGAYSKYLDQANEETLTPDEAQISASDFDESGEYDG